MTFYISTLLVVASAASVFAETVTVSTRYGDVVGSVHDVEGKQYHAFLGIPFAKPPVNESRFMPLERPDEWDVLNATMRGPPCPQPVLEAFGSAPEIPFSEDCLYLNVFVSANTTETRLPVMVFIHGGGFVVGGSHDYPGHILPTQGEPIVLVVIQYRLGLLGFMTTGDERIPGNAGLKDQVFALQWVQDNIRAFGGDKDRVTIFGESTGGESVFLHMVSPMSEGLFHRAIVQSGSGAWRYPKKETFKGLTEENAQNTGCEGDILECLQGAHVNDLLGFESPVVIDGEFLTEDPWISYSEGRIHDADFMVGFTNDAGDVILEYLDIPIADVSTSGISNPDTYDLLLRLSLNAVVSDVDLLLLDTNSSEVKQYDKCLRNIEQLMATIRGKYTSSGDPVGNTRGVLDALRDSFFVTFSVWAVTQVANHHGKARIYSFELRAEYLPVPGEVPLYAPHGHDLEYLFGYSNCSFHPYTDEEIQVGESMVKAWTSFATNGRPKFLTMQNETVAWPLFGEEKNYVVFNTDMSPDSVQDLDTTWQPVTDMWLAIQSFAQFEGHDKDKDRDDKDSDSEEFESNILEMDEFEADIAVLLLSFVAFLLLISTCGLACHVCRGSRKSNHTS